MRTKDEITQCLVDLQSVISALDNSSEPCSESLKLRINNALLKLSHSVEAIYEHQENELDALSRANVSMVMLIEAINQWKEADIALQRHGNDEDIVRFRRSLQDLMDATEAGCSIIMFYSDNGKVSNFYSIGIGDEEIKSVVSKVESIDLITVLFSSMEVEKIDDVSKDKRLSEVMLDCAGMTGLINLPLVSGGGIKGSILLINKKNRQVFDKNDLMICSLFKTEISNVMERNELIMQVHQEKKEQESLIEEINMAHSQLLQSEKMASIGSLAAGVAHEINNPVGYINSNIRSLKTYVADLFEILDKYEQLENMSPDEKTNEVKALKKKLDIDYLREDILELVKESEEGVNRVKKIVQDLKDFSHVDEAEWQWADIHHGIESTLNIVHNETKYKAEVVTEFADVPEIECIISQLNQVFMNIIVNSAQAIEDKGVIKVKTEMKSDDFVRVSVTDNGKGISAENLKRIFDPFFTTKPVGKGTGLGLSLSFGIIEKHHGKIDVESELGKGTTFVVDLPVRQPESMAI